jgi:aminoglycoside phosphotransferase (APT) family kinase protein
MMAGEARRAGGAAAIDPAALGAVAARALAGSGRLAAQHATYRRFALAGLAERLDRLWRQWLTTGEIAAVRRVVAAYDAWFDGERSCLAHGDFDVTHIYQRDGEYTGIIDFGEIRGANRHYDLAQFALHDGERLPRGLLPHLLAGDAEVAPLPPDADRRIALASLLIGVGALARVADRPPPSYQAHLVGAIRWSLSALGARVGVSSD